MIKRNDSFEYYDNLWRSAIVLPEWTERVEKAVDRAMKCRPAYINAAKQSKLPWGFFLCTHWLEASCDPKRQILNGEPWNQITTLEPDGLGPFQSWEAAAMLGIQRMGVTSEDLSTLQGMLFELEKWNGMGYRNLGKNSPYLWSGTQHGVGCGKFVRDHVYDANAVSGQVGCVAILKRTMEREGAA